MESNGYIKLFRNMTEWEWYDDPVVRSVYIHLLLTATWKPSRYHGYELNPGDAVIGQKSLAAKLGFSQMQIRRALKILEKSQNVTLKTTHRFTVATVEKWTFYQHQEKKATQSVTLREHSENTQTTPYEEDKNIRTEESVYQSNIINSVREGLSEADYAGLTERYGFVDDLIKETDSRIRARKDASEIRNMYAYILAVARELDWPSAEEEREKRRQREQAEKVLEKAAAAPEMTDEEKARAAELRKRYGVIVGEILDAQKGG